MLVKAIMELPSYRAIRGEDDNDDPDDWDEETHYSKCYFKIINAQSQLFFKRSV